METNVAQRLTENQTEDFQNHQDRRVRFKERMALQLLLSKRPRKAIAEDMGITQGLLSEWLNEKNRESMPSHWLDAWTREVGPGLLGWIAKENGYQLVKADDSASQIIQDAGQLLALIARHSGSLIASIIQAREDGVVDGRECLAVYPEIMRIIQELEAEAEQFRPQKAAVNA